MKKNTLIALLFAFSSFTWFSCQNEEVIESEIDEKANESDPWSTDDNSLFWKISGNGLEQPAHLFGTIHLIPENDFSFEEALDSLLDESTSLMLEVDISNPQIVAAAQSRMVHQPGEGPENYFSPDELEDIKALCKAVGTSWESVKHLNLISLEGYISTQILKQDMNVSSGYETYLIDEAKEDGTPITGAEDADYVCTYYDNVPAEDAASRLLDVSRKYLEDKETYLALYNQMVQTYLAQDLIGLHFTSFEVDGTSLYEPMVIDRNLAWMKALENDLDGKFIAVGAAHLGGKNGLVQLLQAKGYEVTALKIAR